MANRRLQCRQVFWRNGWSTASERAGELRLDSAAPAVAQQRGPARSVGARGGHEGPAQSRALTPRLKSASTLPDCSRTSPAQEVVPDCLRSGTRADRRSVRPSSPSPPPASGGQPPAQLLPRHHRPPGVAEPSGGFARGRASTPIQTWAARARAPPTGAPGATTDPARPHGCRVRQTSLPRHSSGRSTERPFASSSSTTPSGPSQAVPSREGTPGPA